MNCHLQTNFSSRARISGLLPAAPDCSPKGRLTGEPGAAVQIKNRKSKMIGRSAFTLMEVMIAMGIFFMAIFAILELVSSCLRNARLIQKEHMDTRPIMTALYQTNKYVEGSDSGEFEGWDLNWDTDTEPDETQGSNGLWRIQATISGPGGSPETNWVLIWGEPPPANGVPRG